ncbi:Porphobilinogen deaminase [Commensalibacter sp. Nvir]|uniref:hydroxymethylbilane synthase n=1 Tax=Commensalibacter sp. Nvir TaxID=3069817 RepID=UPI002D2E0453|nr:Porphobilinogen deaminase [Commensalibacter sp. Nvir]
MDIKKNLNIPFNPALQKVAAKTFNRLCDESYLPSHHKRGLPLRVGTRGSPLALVQTRNFLTRLTQFCPLLRQLNAFQEFQIPTSGDRIQDRRLADIGGKGLFAKEIHEQLIEGKIDFAVHSLKDLETCLPKGLVLACTLKRQDARDALIVNANHRPVNIQNPFNSLPRGAIIGTSSVRRQAQLLHMRPDLQIKLLRGNVQSRIDKISAKNYDATLLAAAGLQRLGMEDRIDAIIDPCVMLPAAGQGIVGVTVRKNDTELLEMLSAIEDYEAKAVSSAERALLAELDGSCHTPIGGYAQLFPTKDHKDYKLSLTGMVAREDGSFLLKKEISGSAEDAELLGHELGKQLKKDSPKDIFEE